MLREVKKQVKSGHVLWEDQLYIFNLELICKMCLFKHVSPVECHSVRNSEKNVCLAVMLAAIKNLNNVKINCF